MEPIDVVRNRAYELLKSQNAALETGDIDEDEWYGGIAAVVVPAYLAGDNPRSQSGHSGDETHWEQARSLIMDAVDKNGTATAIFLSARI